MQADGEGGQSKIDEGGQRSRSQVEHQQLEEAVLGNIHGVNSLFRSSWMREVYIQRLEFAAQLRVSLLPQLVYSQRMEIGAKLRELREAKNLSQGDVEKRTGLFRCYTSRVENGYTVPTVETL
jgi:hypothetical protein